MRFHLFACLAVLLLALASPVRAAEEKDHGKVALGFHSIVAPIGARIQVAEYYGLDLGVGFSSTKGQDDTAIDIGVPITVKELNGVRVLFRPGFLAEKFDRPWGDTKVRTLSAELEGEGFFTDDFSVSAAFGVASQTVDRPRVEDVTTWRSTGGEFTNVGFHLYLFK
jgi:hypothetical protein